MNMFDFILQKILHALNTILFLFPVTNVMLIGLKDPLNLNDFILRLPYGFHSELIFPSFMLGLLCFILFICFRQRGQQNEGAIYGLILCFAISNRIVFNGLCFLSTFILSLLLLSHINRTLKG